jgi:hypothetical protein
MTPIEFVVCVTALTALVGERNASYTAEWRTAIARNICAAANNSHVDPRALAAIAMNESGNFDLRLSVPAARGSDLGAFQVNSYFQAHRDMTRNAQHPFYGASIAAEILRENIARYGMSWKAIAAYWNPAQAERGTPEAKRYYLRWEQHYRIVERHFDAARKAQRFAVAPSAGNDVVATSGGQ